MRNQFLFSLRKISSMKYIVVLFCLFSSMSFAQKASFGLKAPLNLAQSKNQVESNPVFDFGKSDFSELVLFMKSNQLDNLPVDVVVSATGYIQRIEVSTMKDLQSLVKLSHEEVNVLLKQFIGNLIIESPALYNKKPVGFSTTIVLFQSDSTLTLNPILHN